MVAVVDAALARRRITTAKLLRWKDEMPSEAEMLPRDKYTLFDRKERRYRKGIHSKSGPFVLHCYPLVPCDSSGIVTACFSSVFIRRFLAMMQWEHKPEICSEPAAG